MANIYVNVASIISQLSCSQRKILIPIRCLIRRRKGRVNAFVHGTWQFRYPRRMDTVRVCPIPFKWFHKSEDRVKINGTKVVVLECNRR